RRLARGGASAAWLSVPADRRPGDDARGAADDPRRAVEPAGRLVVRGPVLPDRRRPVPREAHAPAAPDRRWGGVATIAAHRGPPRGRVQRHRLLAGARRGPGPGTRRSLAG